MHGSTFPSFGISSVNVRPEKPRPDLLDKLWEAVQAASVSNAPTQRSFLVMYHVVNLLGSKRLQAGRKQFNQVRNTQLLLIFSAVPELVFFDVNLLVHCQ